MKCEIQFLSIDEPKKSEKPKHNLNGVYFIEFMFIECESVEIIGRYAVVFFPAFVSLKFTGF